ncbi:hypothetical protein Tfu_1249 [Thermobifida fusca YX]|nr:hypothetical protein Tfu_1249 [Thermobifida fusca YX]
MARPIPGRAYRLLPGTPARGNRHLTSAGTDHPSPLPAPVPAHRPYSGTRMNHIDHPVTLYAGPLDGLVMPAAELEELVREYCGDRLVFLSCFGVSGLYQEQDGQWVYAAPGLLDKKR